MSRDEKYEAILTIPIEGIDINPFEAASIEEELGRRIGGALLPKLNGHEKIVRLGEVEQQAQTDLHFTAYKQRVVVEDIVRCKDCVFFESGIRCGLRNEQTDCNGFCSKGRKTDVD